MSSLTRLIALFLCALLVVSAIPMMEDNEFPQMAVRKRMSNEALLRLMMRNRPGRSGGLDLKQMDRKRSDVERRSIDDDFSNCFLSPVQCMLPHSK